MKKIWILLLTLVWFSGCQMLPARELEKTPRLALFVGMDISGSFMNGPHYEDSLRFISHYLYAHLNGLGGLEVPHSLFVGSIGGAVVNEPKTFFPIQTFSGKSATEIEAKLREIFPKDKPNPFTDYNAFFEHIALTVRNKNLVLKPISIVLVSDGIPDLGNEKGDLAYKNLRLNPLENLSRNVTIRLLYTDAVVGAKWQNQIPRRRVKVWTQDAQVMAYWKDPGILVPEKKMEEQDKFFLWVKDNVDFGVRGKRVSG